MPSDRPGLANQPTVPVDRSIVGRREDFARKLLQLKKAANRSVTQIAKASAISRSTASNLTNPARAARGDIPARESLVEFLIGCRLIEPAQQEPYLTEYDELYGPPPARAPAAGRWRFHGPDAEAHFEQRAHGRRSRVDCGDMFGGRQAALDLLRGLLTGPGRWGLPVVISGQPGAGKSTVLARAVWDLRAAGIGPGVAIHAHGLPLAEVTAAIATACRMPKSTSGGDLLRALLASPPPEGLVVAVDALDEAANTPARSGIARLLADLARLPAVRVAVATRPQDPADPHRPGSLLACLGVTNTDGPTLLNLDNDRFFDVNDLRGFAAAVLAGHHNIPPTGSDQAWTTYQADPALAERLAGVIAERAGRNYLVAALAATHLATAVTVVDPDSLGFDRSMVPATVWEAISKYTDTLEPRDRARTLGLLTALAYARGVGVSDHRWLAFATALRFRPSQEDLDELRHTPTADYLLQATPEHGGRVTRLFHQALADELVTRVGDRRADEQAVLATLLPVEPSQWAAADSYTLTHIAEHAAAAGHLPELLRDAYYLAAADLTRLHPFLSTVSDDDQDLAETVAVLRRAAHRTPALPPPRRATVLALTAAHFGLSRLQQQFSAAAGSPLRVRWAHSLGTPHQSLVGHGDAVNAVTVGRGTVVKTV